MEFDYVLWVFSVETIPINFSITPTLYNFLSQGHEMHFVAFCQSFFKNYYKQISNTVFVLDSLHSYQKCP